MGILIKKYMEIFQPSLSASANQIFPIASIVGMDANALATTTLNWVAGLNAGNTMPMFVQISRLTGTLSLMIATLNLSATIIQPISAASSVLLGSSSSPVQFSLDTTTSTTAFPNSGNWSVVIGTINGSGATISVTVWGLKTS